MYPFLGTKKSGSNSLLSECALGQVLPPISDRMRKRKAFADKELDDIMMQREISKGRGNAPTVRQSQPFPMPSPPATHFANRESQFVVPSHPFYSALTLSPFSAFLRAPNHRNDFLLSDEENSPGSRNSPDRHESVAKSSSAQSSPKSFSIPFLADDFYLNEMKAESRLDRLSSREGKCPNTSGVKKMKTIKAEKIEDRKEENLKKLCSSNILSAMNGTANKVYDRKSHFELDKQRVGSNNPFNPIWPSDPSFQRRLNLLSMVMPIMDQRKVEEKLLQYSNIDRAKHFEGTENPSSDFFPHLFCQLDDCYDPSCHSGSPHLQKSSGYFPAGPLAGADLHIHKAHLAKFYAPTTRSDMDPTSLLLPNISSFFNLLNLQQLQEQHWLQSSETNRRIDFDPHENLRKYSSPLCHKFELPCDNDVGKRRRLSSTGSDTNAVEFEKGGNNGGNYHSKKTLQERKIDETFSNTNDCHELALKPNESVPENDKLTPESYSRLTEPFRQNGVEELSPIRCNDDPERLHNTSFLPYFRPNALRSRNNNENKLTPFTVQSIIGKARA